MNIEEELIRLELAESVEYPKDMILPVLEVLQKFISWAPVERPENGDSIGNYDDTFSDGYDAACFDLKEALAKLNAKTNKEKLLSIFNPPEEPEGDEPQRG